MAGSKSENATPKRRRDAAKRGQSFKARDLVVACLSMCGVLFVVWQGSFSEIGAAFVNAMRSGFALDLNNYVADVFLLGLKIVASIILLSVIASALPSLLQSGFSLAPEALKLNFDALNPVKGLKKIFSIRTLKDVVKTVLYLLFFGVAIIVLWVWNRELIFSQIHSSISEIIEVWKKLLTQLVLICLGCIMVVLILDALAEYFLYLKELKMDKEEIKRERKDLEGDPLIKNQRKRIRIELLTAQEKHDIENSRVVIANPTHVAIAIYFKPELSPIPFVSIRERNQRALAVRRYAEKIGIPIVVDVALARRLYHTHKRYSMVSMDEIHAVVRVLLWLQQVELAGASKEDFSYSYEDETVQESATGKSYGPVQRRVEL